jgi:DNA ligase-1
MLLAELVATSTAVGATRARTAKIAALAELLGRLEPAEVEPAVAFLCGEPRQGRIGVGWATLAGLDVPAAATPSLAIEELDAAVAALLALSGAGSVRARAELLTGVLGRATDAESEFIRRLLTGELRQGALAGIMAEAVARAASVPPAQLRRAAMLAGDLPRVASLALSIGSTALDAIGLQVLRPVQPMLAATSASVSEAMDATGQASVEWKLDGARIQAHRAGDQVALFTRNLNDVTSRLPGVAAVVRALPVDTVVLDGEVLGAGDGEGPDSFQDTISQFSRHEGGGEGLAVFFFDVLHLDGRDLIDEPLLGRLAVLESIAARWRVPSLVTADVTAAAAFSDAALAAGHEGVMVKAAGSRYEAGRRGSSWRKVKPVRTLDLVVLAAEWGHGRRRGWLSNLHLGARDPSAGPAAGPGGGFVMVGKTFKGLTDALLTWQTEQLLARVRARHGIVVEVEPELVVEIALDGVQVSPRYPGGVALRFARVRRYRDDKPVAETDTIDDVRALLPRSARQP